MSLFYYKTKKIDFAIPFPMLNEHISNIYTTKTKGKNKKSKKKQKKNTSTHMQGPRRGTWNTSQE